ncbi:bifunctional 4-hydroxy-2-oxoglutarate aldolase/2-dehydro-3-deoxy-phosphogluconate aldolase [Microterricola pindariensis]|uniref:2-dehydro-3-deoxyphosphogluconate aldolase n=1 Tax=Microterricola pindariensis TaxID=478010 RepID=A0ABX5ARD6_9MICO|nr:bifunctional 4-hydroxy-2-oxoglutarate aldolase/2-dehydro-3-deoxy-phosphogluconate aldolase [Microterricola pindariensis]PPL14551.1 2-dehydro-3-deoxyphosphogluconate aldolase [Microterricola pindariensis]
MANDIETLLGESPIMAILRNMTPDASVALAHRAWDLGIDLVEVPIQTPDAVPSLEAVIRAGAERGKLVGSGTIVTVEQVEVSKRLGAAFSVAPGLNRNVAEASTRLAVPHLPGVATATEIQDAVGLGFTWVKAFPAAVLGTSWFTTMRGPFPNVRFVATGGMDAGNARAFLAAGVSTVAVGAALADPNQVDLLAEILAEPRS